MGLAQSADLAATAGGDAEWLGLPTATAVFDDAFIEERFGSLPSFGEHELAAPASAAEPGASAAPGVQEDIARMVELVVSSQVLNSRESDRLDGAAGPVVGEDARAFQELLRKRSRLLQRINLSLVRQSAAAAEARAAEPGADGEPEGGAAIKEATPGGFLTASSIRIAITLLKSLRGANPAVFSAMCETLMDLLRQLPPLALAAVAPGSVEDATLENVLGFTRDAADQGGDQDQAVSLMLGFATCAASLRGLLDVVLRLVLSETPPRLTADGLRFLERIAAHSVSTGLFCFEPTAAAADRPLSSAADAGAPAAVAADEHFLYLLDTTKGVIVKLTKDASEVVAESAELGLRADTPSWLAAGANGRLHLRQQGDRRVRVLDATTLHEPEAEARADEEEKAEGDIQESKGEDGPALAADGQGPLVLVDVLDGGLAANGVPLDWKLDAARAAALLRSASFYTNGDQLGVVASGIARTFSLVDGSPRATVVLAKQPFSAAVCYSRADHAVWNVSGSTARRFACQGVPPPRAEDSEGAAGPNADVSALVPESPPLDVAVALVEQLDRLAQLYQPAGGALRSPFCVDASKPAFAALIKLVLHYAAADTDAHPFMLAASMRILQANVRALLAAPAKDRPADCLSAEDREALRAALLDLIDSKAPAASEAVVREALALFVAALDLFYPTPADQAGLLSRYLRAPREGRELQVLQQLLAKLSDIGYVSELARGDSAEDLVEALMRITAADAAAALEAPAGQGKLTAVTELEMLTAMSKHLLSDASLAAPAKGGEAAEEGGGPGLGAAGKLMRLLCDESHALIDKATTFEPMLPATDALLRDSVLGVLLPLFTTVLCVLVTKQGAALAPALRNVIPPMASLLARLAGLAATVPEERRVVKSGEARLAVQSEALESEHPYACGLNESRHVKIAGATSLTIAFAEETCTERQYDFVRFFTDEARSNGVGDTYSGGRGGSDRSFPGLDGMPPLVVPGDEVFVQWKTDDSNVDWGWRCVVSGTVAYESGPQRHWLLQLETAFAHLAAATAAALVSGGGGGGDQPAMAPPELSQSLLCLGMGGGGGGGGGGDAGNDDDDDDDDQAFLRDLVENRPDSEGARLGARMRALVAEDQGQLEYMNRAVRATAAALLKHNRMVDEARRQEDPPSPRLVKTWRAAQKMRGFFTLLETGNDTEGRAERAGQRAEFLLRFTVGEGAADMYTAAAPAAAAEAGTLHGVEKWTSLVTAEHSKELSQLRDIFSFQRQAAERQRAQTELSVTEKVLAFVQSQSSVEGLEAAIEQRNTRARQRAEGYALLGALLDACPSPNMQAWMLTSAAAAGGGHFLSGLEGCSAGARRALSASFSQQLQTMAGMLGALVDEASSLDGGAGPTLQPGDGVEALVACLLRTCNIDYGYADHGLLFESELMARLRPILAGGASLPGSVVRAAWTLFGSLVDHCVGLDGETSHEVRSLDEASPFQRELLGTLLSQLEHVTAPLVARATTAVAVEESPAVARPMLMRNVSWVTSPAEAEAAPNDEARRRADEQLPPYVGLLEHPTVVRLRRDEPGLVAPHHPMTTTFTMALWVQRNRPRARESGLACVGDRVVRGSHWHFGDADVAGPGTVVEVVEQTRVRVKWDRAGGGSDVRVYRFGHEGRYDVAAIEPCAGVLWAKGYDTLLGEDEVKLGWSSFRLEMDAHGRLQFRIGCGEDQFETVASASALPEERWSHVAVTCARTRVAIFIDGVQDAEAVVRSQPGSEPEKAQMTVETPHPYNNNMNDNFPVSIPGARKITVTFDERTRTEHNYDFATFYTDASHSERIGEEKYTGRDGRANWPGLGGRPPLVIERDSFVVHFKSDGSNTDWGFLITAEGDVPVDAAAAEAEVAASASVVTNTQPFYVGQPPLSWGVCTDAADCWVADLRLFDVPLSGAQLCESVSSSGLCRPRFEAAGVSEGFAEPLADGWRFAAAARFPTLVLSNVLLTEGAWYYEVVVHATGIAQLGWADEGLVAPEQAGSGVGDDTHSWAFDGQRRVVWHGSSTAWGATWSPGDVVGVLADLDARTISYSLNGSFAEPMGVAFSDVAGPLRLAVSYDARFVGQINLGEHPWRFGPPAGAAGVQELLRSRATAVGSQLAPPPPLAFQEPLCLEMLVLMRRCCKSAVGRRAFAVPNVLLLVLHLVHAGPFTVRLAALRLCASLFQSVSPEVVDAQLRAVVGSDKGGLVQFLFGDIGEALLLWPTASASGAARQGGGTAFALAEEKVHLLRALAVARQWTPQVVAALCEALRTAPAVAQSLQEGALCEARALVAALAVLGGHFSGLRVGALVRCRIGEGEVSAVEEGTVVGLPPRGDRPAWVLLHSKPDAPVQVPSGKVSPQPRPLGADLCAALLDDELLAALSGAFMELVDVRGDGRPRYKPLVKRSHEKRMIETPHPYANNYDKEWIVTIEGAEQLTLAFDDDCSSENNCDYVRIYQGAGRTRQIGDKYCGPRGSWGEPVVIKGDTVVVTFHSDGSNTDWGARMHISADATVTTQAPVRPPTAAYALLTELCARGVKTLWSLMQHEAFVPRLLAFTPRLITTATAPLPTTRSAPPQRETSLESTHPYADNHQSSQMLRVPGAKKLVISFQEQTSTEKDYDFVRFYKEADEKEHWGESKYSGGRSGSVANWPGLGGRPPLEIPADHCVVHFKTDGSNNDWGWKLVAVGVMAEAVAGNAGSDELSRRLNHVAELLYEGPAAQEGPDEAAFVGFEFEMPPVRLAAGVSVASVQLPQEEEEDESKQEGGLAESKEVDLDLDLEEEDADAEIEMASSSPVATASAAASAAAAAGAPGTPGTPRFPRDYKVAVSSALVYEQPHTLSARVGQLSSGATVTATAGRGDWLCVPWRADASVSVASDHPYMAGARRYWPVHIPGAAQIVVSFGAQCATGSERDYVCLFKDSSHTEHWGAPSYSGSWSDTLVVPADSLVVYFHSETGGAWGFSLTATAKAPEGSQLLRDAWVQRRHADQLYLLPAVSAADVAAEQDTVLLEDDDADDASAARVEERPAAEAGNPMYEVEDSFEEVRPSAAGSTELVEYVPHEDLRGQSGRLWTLATETALASTVCVSREATLGLVARWPSSVPFSTSVIGSKKTLMQLLTLTYEGSAASSRDALLKKLQAFVGTGSAEARGFAAYLVHHCRHELSRAVSAVRTKPQVRAAKQEVESKHNYDDNSDLYWTVSFPNATKIKVVFDPQTKTERGYDFVRFYKDGSHSSHWGADKYSGGRGGTEANWPGLGGKPPLWIPASSFVVHFKSDGSNNDWGFKLTAYGVLADSEEAQRSKAEVAVEAERAEAEALAAAARTGLPPGPPNIPLACWLLELLMPLDVPAVTGVLYSPSTLATFGSFVTKLPPSQTLRVVHLLTAMLSEPNAAARAGRRLLPSVMHLRSVVAAEVAKVYKSELSSATKTPYLQALVECSIALRRVVTLAGAATEAEGEARLASELWGAAADAGLSWSSKGAGDAGLLRTQEEFSRGRHAWTMVVDECGPRGVALGLVVDGEMAVRWGEGVLRRGDVVEATLDCEVGSWSLVRNSVPVGEVASGLRVGSYAPAAIAVDGAVSLRPSSAAAAAAAAGGDEDWLRDVCRAMHVLTQVSAGLTPEELVARDFVPTLVLNGTTTVETAHPFPNEPMERTHSCPGAASLEVRFGPRTALGPRDVVTVSAPTLARPIVLRGGLVGGTPQEASTLVAGTLVVRGPDWDWEDQDGGPGCFGEVLEQRAWSGVEGGGVVVRWIESGFQNVYRNSEGARDVTRAPPHASMVMGRVDAPLLVPGSEVTIRVDPEPAVDLTGVVFRGSLALPAAGSGGLVTDSRAPEALGAGDFCVEGWVCFGPKVAGKFSPVLSVGPYGALQDDVQCVVCVQADADGRWGAFMGNAEQEYGLLLTGPKAADAGRWSHVALSMAGAEATLFVDGEAVASGAFRGTRLAVGTQPLRLGAYGVHRLAGGSLHDVRVWNGARAAAPHEAYVGDASWPLNDPAALGVSFVAEFDAEEGVDLAWTGPPSPYAERLANWGLAARVTPSFSQSVHELEHFSGAFAEFVAQHADFTPAADMQLVQYLNDAAHRRGLHADALLDASFDNLLPTEEDTRKYAVLATPRGRLEARFRLLQGVNSLLRTALPLIDLSNVQRSWSLASRLSRSRHVIYNQLKLPIWAEALTQTKGSGGQLELTLSRSRAAKYANVPDVDGRFSLFAQAFRQLHQVAPARLRRHGQLYKTIFAGEMSHDAGGPYRESLAAFCQELQSAALPLLIPSQNNRHSAGQGRDAWIPNPGATGALALQMFGFLGQLMGLAIRNHEYLPLHLPSIVWKPLVNETPGASDVRAVDELLMTSLDRLRDIHLQGVTEEMFEDVMVEVFDVMGSDGVKHELEPGGAERAVTFQTRFEYADAVERFRAHEFDRQCAAIRRGLATVVPQRLLTLFQWHELELFVCGKPEVDLALLREATNYSGINATDAHVQMFWRVLESFDQEERSLFLRFVWGRSRLPLSVDQFSSRFKIQSFNHSPADKYLPVAHTCFFSLELPAYSTESIMREKMLYAIHNCAAIDFDGTAQAASAARLGWED